MKQSQLLIPTMKETPSDAESVSHQLLLRAGYIRQNAAGIYSYLPLGFIVLQKIEEIIREEMNATGAQELLMPAIQPAELWHETGRWNVYGPELMRLKDRHGRDFALGATHEELITSLVRDELNSYKKLPMTLYQIQTKYRDERRPRFGLLRGREFIMKDAYSFHDKSESLDERYQMMYDAYSRVFERCGLNFRAVIADSGAMGGKDTHEFHALASIGEDTIAYSDESDYAANTEMAEVLPPDADFTADAEVQAAFFRANDDTIAVYYLKGDEVNDVKVKNVLGVEILEALTDEEIQELQFDPLNPSDHIKVMADQWVEVISNGSLFVGEGQKRYNDINFGQDLHIKHFHDLRFIKEGDPSPDGRGWIKFARGIEIGQVFKLGTRYSEAMNAVFLDEQGKSKPLIMGCYGIGVSRTLSAVAEQYHDEKGLTWPNALAPYKIHIIPVNVKNDEQLTLAEQLHLQLGDKWDVLLDDRKERAGVKFADADLIGCPVRITVGKRAGEGYIEVKIRKTGDMLECHIDELNSVIEAQMHD
ncbi:proline--tRNA ligase [Scopulibacillus darangshiensis]|nr:proline--tRNA ligase [Scopulibacillus darangshiensis]